MKIIIYTVLVLPLLLIFCNKDIEIDPRIYGTWKCIDCERPANDSKDTISISFSNDSLKDSICRFIAFYENRSYEYYEINGTNNHKIIYQKGNVSTKDDVYCLSYACYYNMTVSNDTLKMFQVGDPGLLEFYRKFTICWTEN